MASNAEDDETRQERLRRRREQDTQTWKGKLMKNDKQG